MRIAVIDVAAENGGALSVLRDFLSYVTKLDNKKNEYYVFVSKEVDIWDPCIHYVLKPQIKKSWLNRIKWERFDAIKELKQLRIDVVFSLQNTAFFSNEIRQIVYFHNVLLLEPKGKYSLFKKEERLYGIYTRVVAPYTLNSLKMANTIVCQTNTVRKKIQKRISGVNVVAVNPNVYVDDMYVNAAVRPIKGFIYPTAAVPFKHIEEVINCARKYNSWFETNKLELLITISGKENAYAQTVYEQGKNTPNIHFIGYQPRNEILKIYRDHALIINSELESFPIPFKEAEIIGSPIVAAGYDYAAEILNDCRNARLYIPHDIDSMFSSIKETYYSMDEKKIPVRNNNTWSDIHSLL